MAYTKYSLTPANNTATPPDGAPEGMLPSAVNDTMRDMMAQIRDCGDGIRDGTYTMTAPVITGGSITGVALSGNTFTNPVITGGSINNTPIGASTANTGAFTTLSASGATTFSGATVVSGSLTANTFSSSGATITGGTINSTAIGGSTAAAGAFTTLSASGVATFSAGTVSAPALTTTGDTNTGIFFPAADTIAFTEGGVESMRIDSSGNVGIGMTPIGDTALEIYNANSATVYKNVNTGTDGSSGFYVGMGKSSATEAYVYNRENNNIIFGTNNTERMRITSGGDLLVAGSTGGQGRVRVISTADNYASGGFCSINVAGNYWNIIMASNAVGNQLYFGYNNGDKAYIDPSTGSWNTVSDKNLKKEITDIPYGLKQISMLRPVEYLMKEENVTSQKHLGFIAQEVKEIIPSCVSTMMSGMLGMDKQELIPVLVKAIQEQQAMIEELKQEVAALKASH